MNSVKFMLFNRLSTFWSSYGLFFDNGFRENKCPRKLEILVVSSKSVKFNPFKKIHQGLHFFRYDYENVTSESGNTMMANLREMVSTKSLTGRQYGNFVVKDVDDFRYEDPIDLSVSEKQVRSHHL